MKSILIAESGGTKTDWCLIQDGVVTKRTVSFSLHPANWNLTFFEEVDRFLKAFLVHSDVPMIIYSAGCHKESNRRELTNQIEKLGYIVEVESDLIAAGRSLGEEELAHIAILGTGSVLFTFENNRVRKVVGGKGHHHGDEGSGYYFGKLLLEKWKANSLNEYQVKLLDERFDLMDLWNSIGTDSEKGRLASVAKELADRKELFRNEHVANFRLFCENHAIDKNIQSLSIIGSYGYHHREILMEVFSAYGVEVLNFIERPIDILVEQTMSLTD